MMNKTKSPAQKLAKYLIALPLALLLVVGNSVYAQNQKGDEIFTEVEKYPEFPGGNPAFMKFLADGIKYPVKAQENGEQGRVVANFVVEKDGSISNIKVIKGVTAALDAEAVRLLNSMPRWEPGEHRNQPARVRFTLPVVFRLQGENLAPAKSPALPISADVHEKGKMLDEIVVVAYGKHNTYIPPSPPLPGRDNAESNGNELFDVVEVQPQYPGGNEAMKKFISENLQYPKIAQENGIQGRVITQFIIEKDGSLSDIQIVRGVDPSLDKEAVRLIGTMPAWVPGTQRGNKVRVRYTLPITFRLEDQTSSENRESPEFPGGEDAYMKFLSDNIKYPVIAQENGIQGLIDVVFNINSKGKVTFVRFNNTVDPSLDQEARRVIELMPDWIPGKLNGEATSVTTGASFVFRLQGDDTEPYTDPVPKNAIVVVGYGKKK